MFGSEEPGRVWFYKPQLDVHWPVFLGHDEYARRVLVLGFPFTGRVLIALWKCGDTECLQEREVNLRRYNYDHRVDAWYFEVGSQKARVAGTKQLGSRVVNLDYDESGTVIGVEVL